MSASRYLVGLVAPGVGIVLGSFMPSRAKAATLLSDRQANGEAFPGECVARIPARVIAPGWHRVEWYGRRLSLRDAA